MEAILTNARGERITIKDIREGYWITTKTGTTRCLRDTIPRKCDECGFPAMEIMERDYERHIVTLGCFWCDSLKELCVVCGKIDYSLGDHNH